MAAIKSILKGFVYLGVLLAFSSGYAMEVPDCKKSEPLASPIHFFASEDILQVHTESEVLAIVESWFKFSEQTMENSCIPLKRTLKTITYLEDVNIEFMYSRGTAKYAVESAIESSTDDLFSKNELGYVGVLVESGDALQNCGEAVMGSNFFIIALDCANYVMEHELGHLAGAGHDMQTILADHGSIENARHVSFPKSEEYAFGWRCANSGTVMSYALGQNLPIYSSPDIYVKGQQCGNLRYGNNAQVLRDFVAKYR